MMLQLLLILLTSQPSLSLVVVTVAAPWLLLLLSDVNITTPPEEEEGAWPAGPTLHQDNILPDIQDSGWRFGPLCGILVCEDCVDCWQVGGGTVRGRTGHQGPADNYKGYQSHLNREHYQLHHTTPPVQPSLVSTVIDCSSEQE